MSRKVSEELAVSYQDFLKEIGQRVRELRQKSGWTQSQLADRANMYQTYIFEIENGSARPTIASIARLADAFGVDARDLLPEGPNAVPSRVTLDRLEALVNQLLEVLEQIKTQAERLAEEEARRRAEEIATIRTVAADLQQLPALRSALARRRIENEGTPEPTLRRTRRPPNS